VSKEKEPNFKEEKNVGKGKTEIRKTMQTKCRRLLMMPIPWHGPMSEIRWTCKKKTNNYSFSKKSFPK